MYPPASGRLSASSSTPSRVNPAKNNLQVPGCVDKGHPRTSGEKRKRRWVGRLLYYLLVHGCPVISLASTADKVTTLLPLVRHWLIFT